MDEITITNFDFLVSLQIVSFIAWRAIWRSAWAPWPPQGHRALLPEAKKYGVNGRSIARSFVTFDTAVQAFGDRLGLNFGLVARSNRLEHVDVTLNGRVVGRVYGNAEDGFIFQMALLADDLPAGAAHPA